ncbi:MAG: xanthine dehydrogenase family protein subunit M [Firmicutes bacterium]|nr:xanthine dehydrogenase family protein subunit M [Bacillota bacterium]
MKPVPIRYLRATTVDEAVTALARYGLDAKVLAGGQSLMPMLNMRLARPQVVVDINEIRDLMEIRYDPNARQLVVGALVRHQQLLESSLVHAHQPLLSAAARYIGHWAIRNRGTIGGSVVHHDPSAEWPLVTACLGAEFHVQGPQGRRVIPAADFFVTYLTTAVQAGELLTAVVIPCLGPGESWGFQEYARRHGDFALAAAAVTVTLSDGVVTAARIAVGGVADRPVVLSEVTQHVVGQAPTAQLEVQLGQWVYDAVNPLAESPDEQAYKRDIAAVLVRRAFRQAINRQPAGQ